MKSEDHATLRRGPGQRPRLALALVAAIAAAALGATACGASDAGATSTSSSSASGTSSSGSSADTCVNDKRVAAYAVGLEASSKDQALRVRFVDANPAPPAKGNNTFTVEVVDGSGSPVDGATITTTSYMPDHGHYSPIKPTAMPTGKPGTYEISPVNLFMPGVWQITFEVDKPAGAKESVMFTFCAEG